MGVFAVSWVFFRAALPGGPAPAVGGDGQRQQAGEDPVHHAERGKQESISARHMQHLAQRWNPKGHSNPRCSGPYSIFPENTARVASQRKRIFRAVGLVSSLVFSVSSICAAMVCCCCCCGWHSSSCDFSWFCVVRRLSPVVLSSLTSRLPFLSHHVAAGGI